VLVLDEPTHGLDPVWTQRFRDVVASLRRSDRVIVIASHNLDELQRVADRVAIIDDGRLQRVVVTREGALVTATPYRLVVAVGGEHVAELFEGAVPGEDGEFTIPAMALGELNAAVAELVRRGGLVRVLAPAHSALEQQFRDAVRSS
jgi:ABC-type multidrug transport system ATPase subunit